MNDSGQLGDGTTTNSTVPVQVKNLTDVVSISAGTEHSLAVKSDGTVWAWGYASNYQLGVPGIVIKSTVPVQVQNLTLK